MLLGIDVPCLSLLLVHARLCVMGCSMGGILVKEMLAKALASNAPTHHRQLAASTSGLVFYACPHFGSSLANIGWNLRYVGASPAASVFHLKPGKHLEVSLYAQVINAVMRLASVYKSLWL